jgi:hypothetical protein
MSALVTDDDEKLDEAVNCDATDGTTVNGDWANDDNSTSKVARSTADVARLSLYASIPSRRILQPSRTSH